MAEALNVEQRLAVLEREVAALRQRLEQLSDPKKDRIDQVSGSMRDYPEFEEVLRLGAEYRRMDGPPVED